jgi:hypothetical protein
MNDGLQPFTAADLDHFKTGDDPYGHPDVDWYDKIFKKKPTRPIPTWISRAVPTRLNILYQAVPETKRFGARFCRPAKPGKYQLLFPQVQLPLQPGFKANKTLDLRLDVTTRFSDLNQPYNQNAVGEVYNFTKETPFTAPYLNPNGTYSATLIRNLTPITCLH